MEFQQWLVYFGLCVWLSVSYAIFNLVMGIFHVNMTSPLDMVIGKIHVKSIIEICVRKPSWAIIAEREYNIVNYKSAEQSIGIENCCANNTLAYSSTQPDRKNHLLPVSIFMGNFRSNKNENLLQQTIVTKCMARIQSHSLLPWWTPFRWIYSFGPFPRRSN